jgi:hypothetical protein
MYIMVSFRSDEDNAWKGTLEQFNHLGDHHTITGLLEFAQANGDGITGQALEYCNWEGRQTFVSFKDGRQTVTNGQLRVPATHRALRRAVDKLLPMAEVELYPDGQPETEEL